MRSLLLFLLGYALLLSGCATMEKPDGPSDEPRRCIGLSQIAEVKVIDDQSIEFHMLGGTTYINLLPHRCPGLSPNRAFMYRTSLSQLCDLDLITVLESGGFGLMPLSSCGLGRFYPILQGGVPPGED